MMILYKAVIKPRSSFISLLQGDTLFGGFCWSYVYLKGEKALKELLQSEIPAIIFSNAFPAGYVPLPLGTFDPNNDYKKLESKLERKEAYENNKKIKNAKYVSVEAFNNILLGKSEGITKAAADNQYIVASTMHNMVSRERQYVENIEGAGNLYELEEMYMKPSGLFDIYILTSLPEKEVKTTLEMMFLLGIGGKKSIGKGQFELKSFEMFQGFAKSKEANGFVALSNFIPSADDPTEGYYKTFVKYPKLDREFANSEVPFKTPVLFIKAGSVFKTEEVKPYYGRNISNVALHNSDIIISGHTIAIPILISSDSSR